MIKLQQWELLHFATLTISLHYSIILQLAVNELSQLFLLISNPLPQKSHLYPTSPNYFKHIFTPELMDSSFLIGIS